MVHIRYIIARCTDTAKLRLVNCAQGSDYSAFRRPLVLDAFLANIESSIYRTRLVLLRYQLVQYVSKLRLALKTSSRVTQLISTAGEARRESARFRIPSGDLPKPSQAITAMVHSIGRLGRSFRTTSLFPTFVGRVGQLEVTPHQRVT